VKILVVGLGNPLLTDDGVGIHVVRALEGRRGQDPRGVEVAELSLGGLRLLDEMVGYDKVILVDAIRTPQGQVGRVYRLSPHDLHAGLHTGSSHDLSLEAALALGRRLGMQLPSQIVIFAVEVEDIFTFGQECTPRVREAIPRVVEAVLAELGKSSEPPVSPTSETGS